MCWENCADDLCRVYAEQYLEKIYYFCLKKTGNTTEAEDLTSDISLAVLEQLFRGHIPMNFPGWVWQIARNQYSKWADRMRIRTEHMVSDNIADMDIPDPACFKAELAKSEELSLLRRELAFIASEYRNVVVPYYIDDLSLRHIAASLQITEEAAKKRLLRAKKILKEGMEMARKFGTRSYKPEDVRFIASGSQPSGLPWSAVGRKLSKNILLQASNNPSTLEELAMELGVALPYLEEEVQLLVNATLLKQIGKRYITNFYIFDKDTQLDIYEFLRAGAADRSVLVDQMADDLLSIVRKVGAVRNAIMTDAEIKWWLVIYIMDRCCRDIHGWSIEYPEKRASGETWGFMGLEQCVLPGPCGAGHCGCTHGNTAYWMYNICDYRMQERIGCINKAETVALFGDIIRNHRNVSSLTEHERTWGIDERFMHFDDAGNAVFDILVFEGNALSRVERAIRDHARYAPLLRLLQDEFDTIVDMLKARNSEILKRVLPYCASMKILDIRMMTVCKEVEAGKLIVPDDPAHSRVAMWLEVM